MIEITLLREFGAVEKKLKKGEILFQEGEKAFFYYQIMDGSVKMNNYNAEGQEMIQGIFKQGDSFGEPAILGGFPFPANAVALGNAQLICLEKHRFMDLLKKKPEVSIYLLGVLSKRLRFKAMLSKEIKGYEAEHRIMTLLLYLKGNRNTEYCVDITRQTIGNLTGLRVETVIRAIKGLEGKGKLHLRNRKIFI